MQFGRLILIGAVIAALAPAAMADTLLAGEIDMTGNATVSATQILFGNVNGTLANIHYDQSAGTVTGATGSLSGFSSASLWHVPGATDTTHANRNPAKLVYSSATLGTPVLFFQAFEGSDILDFFVTDVTSETVGTGTVKGGLTATGYVTIDGTDQSFGTYTLTDNGFYAGHQGFTSKFVLPVPPPPPPPPPPPIPEPSSLALLGTGMMGVAGFFFRKRGKVQE